MHHFINKLAKSTQSKVLSQKNDRTLNWLDLVTWLPGWSGVGIFVGGSLEGRYGYLRVGLGLVRGREVGIFEGGYWG